MFAPFRFVLFDPPRHATPRRHPVRIVLMEWLYYVNIMLLIYPESVVSFSSSATTGTDDATAAAAPDAVPLLCVLLVSFGLRFACVVQHDVWVCARIITILPFFFHLRKFEFLNSGSNSRAPTSIQHNDPYECVKCFFVPLPPFLCVAFHFPQCWRRIFIFVFHSIHSKSMRRIRSN